MRKTSVHAAAAAVALAAVVLAQTASTATSEVRIAVPFRASIGVGWTAAGPGPLAGAVKGSPYSAIAVTEVVQTLADGNRIRRETTSAVYRDSEGRTRNESEIEGAGPEGAARQFITIHDPVAGVHYMLNPQQKTATKMTMPGVSLVRRVVPGVMQENAVPAASAGNAAPAAIVRHVEMGSFSSQRTEQVKTEQLGTRMFDGVQAEGTRTTITIPAGAIGNERPIEVVSESWFSPQLQAMVMTTHSDPRTGTNTYRLTSINLGEPDRSLFEVPADYKIVERGVIGAAPSDVLVRQRLATPGDER